MFEQIKHLTASLPPISPYYYPLLLLGTMTLASMISRFSSFFFQKFIRSGTNLQKRYGLNNSWAVITGASDGIGKAFCESLAQRGFNVCMIVRNVTKGEQALKELQEKYPKISTALVQADFSLCPQDPIAFFQRVQEDLEKKNVLDIAILVNNAGYADMNRLHKMKEKDIADMIAVNVYPVAFLTRALVGKMKLREKKSLVISLASVSAVIPFPFLGVYGATKAFNHQFSKSMAEEYHGKIDFLSLKPNYVSTKMTKLKAGGMIILPRECAEACLREAGKETETAGHWKHQAMEWIIKNLVPTKLTRGQSEKILGRIEARMKKE